LHCLEGVVLIDESFVKNRRVFVHVLAAFRYGREDLDVLGLSFRKDLFLASAQIYPPQTTISDNTPVNPVPILTVASGTTSTKKSPSGAAGDTTAEHTDIEPKLQPKPLTRLQERLIKKLGPSAYPFYFELPHATPASVTLQPGPNDSGKPCGVDYELRAYIAEECDEKPQARYVFQEFEYITYQQSTVSMLLSFRNTLPLLNRRLLWWEIEVVAQSDSFSAWLMLLWLPLAGTQLSPVAARSWVFPSCHTPGNRHDRRAKPGEGPRCCVCLHTRYFLPSTSYSAMRANEFFPTFVDTCHSERRIQEALYFLLLATNSVNNATLSRARARVRFLFTAVITCFPLRSPSLSLSLSLSPANLRFFIKKDSYLFLCLPLRSSVRMAIRKLTYAPEESAPQPSAEVVKDFIMSPGTLRLEVSLDKEVLSRSLPATIALFKYYHGEFIAVNVLVDNNSNKTVKKVKVSVMQVADIMLFSRAVYKCTVDEAEYE
uniref:Arrestin_C domain-containing protein n=1 Tax=Schistocephalus solidus TaxID=70667 RepID=A0A183SU87_SCHSO